MANPPGVPSALGIDAVEWSSQGADRLLVRVTGHWRRRRLPVRRRPQLVIEAHGQRHRFPALPEPPGLTDVAPGSWQMSFSVPAALAPHLGGRMWLAVGGVLVPLPSTETATRGTELRPSADEEEATGALQARLERLERERRTAEQRAHAEYVMRMELEEELARRSRRQASLEELEAELAEAEEQIRELESELVQTRRQADEAEELLTAARRIPRDHALPSRGLYAETVQSELELAQATPVAPKPRARARALTEPAGLRGERELLRRTAGPGRAARPGQAALLAPRDDRELRAILGDLRQELAALEAMIREERAARAAAEARVAELESELREHAERGLRTYAAIQALREELEAIRSGVGPSIRGGGGDVRHPAPPAESIGTLRPAPAAGPVEPERLEDALRRLRDAGPPSPQRSSPAEQQPEVKPWLGSVFSCLVAREPGLAGRLLLGLLPAQPLAFADPLSYDLVLRPGACVQVSSAAGVARAVLADTPRRPEDVDFQAFGELSALARSVLAGGLRRRLGRGMVRVRGRERGRFAALGALAQVRVTLEQLASAGVRLDPSLALTVVSLMIESRWTEGERFVLAYREPSSESAGLYLLVSDGRPAAVSDAPPVAEVAAEIACPWDRLLPVLTGRDRSPEFVLGEERPLRRVREWLELAQCGRIDP